MQTDNLLFNIDTIDAHMGRLVDISSEVELIRTKNGALSIKKLFGLKDEAEILSKGIKDFIEKRVAKS